MRAARPRRAVFLMSVTMGFSGFDRERRLRFALREHWSLLFELQSGFLRCREPCTSWHKLQNIDRMKPRTVQMRASF